MDESSLLELLKNDIKEYTTKDQ